MWKTFPLVIMALFGQASLADPCADLATQLAQNQCSDQRYQDADHALNQAYKTITQQIPAQPRKMLRQAQRDWITFRDSNCAAQAWEAKGSSPYTAIHADCLTATTRARTAELEKVYLKREANVAETALLGAWRSLASGYGTVVNFRIQDGIRHYFATLNQLPFEAGQWRLEQGRLVISASDGHALHVYHRVTLEQDQLTLYEQDGGIERYQRLATP